MFASEVAISASKWFVNVALKKKLFVYLYSGCSLEISFLKKKRMSLDIHKLKLQKKKSLRDIASIVSINFANQPLIN